MRRRLLIVLATLSALGLAAAILVGVRRHAAPRAPVTALGAFTVPPPPAEPGKQLRPELIEALGFGAASPWERRTDLIRALPADLTAMETDALLAALMEPCPPNVSRAVHATFIHEIARILQPRPDIRARFASALAALARDTGRDASTRDYAIQHLRQAWSRAADDPALRASITTTFRELTLLDPAIATSALLSLHLLGSAAEQGAAGSGRRVPGSVAATPAPAHDLARSFQLPDSDLAPLLEPIFAAKTSTQNMPARLTAVRIAGERRMTAFRQPLLTALSDRTEHTLVRMAAANALWKIGDPEDLETLASLDPGDARVTAAIRQALRPRTPR